MKNKNLIKNLTAFFFEIGSLRKVIRSHRQALLTDDLSDNIASHSFRVTVIGYWLAHQLKADVNMVIKMCLFHDLDETRGGDQHWVNKKYVKVFDNEILEDQLNLLPNNKELISVVREYRKRKTLEAKIAKDADLLDQILLLREYQWAGNHEAENWLKSVIEKNVQEKLLSTNLAKSIAQEIKKQKPSFWWDSLWTNKRR